MHSDQPFSDTEIKYILDQPLGRLSTIGPDGTPQVRPVAFRFNTADGTIDIGGPRLGTTQKYRNVLADPRVAFIIDDVAPAEGSGAARPGQGRGVEIRGRAEALDDQERIARYYSEELIRIRPERIIAWNLSADQPKARGRDVG
ncbi:PPOX class F420-dependent oxidoreductase [Actinomadura rubrisoli]|uniref:PPOX class F420-dependent oxidoreductase n=1 Tax=Actinomadura rubrisoli TaxID=2530368 RepID=A0A4V2YQZ4_9ACTN|nr:PPOX class F420-dependent oxidoreductase [Actinomadura rubrisoli]TDD63747.1 PPOX class F420-dependent oxidoreductase [Actinomadura rubrisoli]